MTYDIFLRLENILFDDNIYLLGNLKSILDGYEIYDDERRFIDTISMYDFNKYNKKKQFDIIRKCIKIKGYWAVFYNILLFHSDVFKEYLENMKQNKFNLSYQIMTSIVYELETAYFDDNYNRIHGVLIILHYMLRNVDGKLLFDYSIDKQKLIIPETFIHLIIMLLYFEKHDNIYIISNIYYDILDNILDNAKLINIKIEYDGIYKQIFEYFLLDLCYNCEIYGDHAMISDRYQRFIYEDYEEKIILYLINNIGDYKIMNMINFEYSKLMSSKNKLFIKNCIDKILDNKYI